MKLKSIKQNILRFLGNHAASSLINLLIKSLSVKRVNADAFDLLSKNKNCIVAFWHGKMFLGWYLQKNRHFSSLVSQSKDGEVLANMLTKWNYSVTRGSSHIGGKEAMEIMVGQTNSGASFAITPDGPKGPRHKMKAGAVVLAKKCSTELFLIGIGFKRKIAFRSWDLFELPFPFTKAIAVYSEPLSFSSDMTYEETSRAIENCETKLNELNNYAESLCLK